MTDNVCDAYQVRQDHTLFFVKKLKGEHTGNSVYRDALAKEYQIGSSLEHPSLPVYRFAGDDYIVMNFVDGETLACLIEKNDDCRLFLINYYSREQIEC